MKRLLCHAWFLVLLFLAVFVIVPNVHADSNPTVHSLSHCAVEFVKLHGNNPPEITCLKPQKTSGKISPLTYGTDCSAKTLELDSADIFGSLTLCFLGTGFINLTDYIWRVWPETWNDRAESYSSGCNSGVFYADINGGGTAQSFGSWETAPFTGLPLANGTLSSFSITQSC